MIYADEAFCEWCGLIVCVKPPRYECQQCGQSRYLSDDSDPGIPGWANFESDEDRYYSTARTNN